MCLMAFKVWWGFVSVFACCLGVCVITRLRVCLFDHVFGLLACSCARLFVCLIVCVLLGWSF